MYVIRFGTMTCASSIWIRLPHDSAEPTIAPHKSRSCSIGSVPSIIGVCGSELKLVLVPLPRLDAELHSLGELFAAGPLMGCGFELCEDK